MSFIHHDRTMEQMPVPGTIVRGGISRGIYFEGKNVPPAGNGLEEFFLAVRGSPDSLAMDGLGGDHTFFITSSHHAGMQVTGDGCPR